MGLFSFGTTGKCSDGQTANPMKNRNKGLRNKKKKLLSAGARVARKQGT